MLVNNAVPFGLINYSLTTPESLWFVSWRSAVKSWNKSLSPVSSLLIFLLILLSCKYMYMSQTLKVSILNSCRFTCYLKIILGCTRRSTSENDLSFLRHRGPRSVPGCGICPLWGARAVFSKRPWPRGFPYPVAPRLSDLWFCNITARYS